MSMSVGEKIKELRTKANLTQNELAAKLFVSRELVCSWELGNRNPGLDVLSRMAELFGVDVHELVCMDSSVADELGSCIPPGMSSGEAVRLINDFLRTLEEEDRTLFVLRYFSFRPTKDISVVLGKRDGTVRNRLVKLRDTLSLFLKEENGNG